MKTRSTTYLAIVFLTTLFFAGCSNAGDAKNDTKAAANNVQTTANNSMRAAQIEANTVKQDMAADWNNFKNEMNAQIARNEARIQELRKKAETAGSKESIRLDSELDKLGKQNDDSRKKLQDEDEKLIDKLTAQDKEAHDKAAAFQREFRHDMEELTKSFKDLGTDNVK